jgi:hypothetical protein
MWTERALAGGREKRTRAFEVGDVKADFIGGDQARVSSASNGISTTVPVKTATPIYVSGNDARSDGLAPRVSAQPQPSKH